MNYKLIPSSTHPGIPDELFAIIGEALKAVDPERAVLRHLRFENQRLITTGNRVYDLAKFENIHVIGVGKGVTAMVKGLERLLGDQITGGIVITKHKFSENGLSGKVTILQGDHPVPGILSVESTARMVEYASRITSRDLVFCLITGGGSALMTLPSDGIALADLQKTTQVLLECGATINEMNTIRKHLDQVKGGGIARMVYPAEMITLVLSDVIGNPLDVIASGPTNSDDSTFLDAIEIFNRYGISEKIPGQVLDLLLQGANGKLPETLKPGSKFLENVHHIVIGDNLQACQAAIQKSNETGFNSLLLTTSLLGEAREAGVMLSAILRQVAETGHPIFRPACILAGGETTVHIKGQGRGGRNQEMALSAVRELAGIENIAFITIGTDGEDGPTNAAGAVVTGKTMQQGCDLSLDVDKYLSDNDSYHYFQQLGASLMTGPTGTNVNDICFLFAY